MRLGSQLALLVLVPSVASGQTQLSVESLAANGQQVRDLSCSLAEGGMFAMVGVVAALAKQKPALDACAPDGAAFKVRWTWSAKPTDAVVVEASLPKAKSCVEKALKATQGPTAGTCTGLVLTGPAPAAEKAAEPMRDQPKKATSEAAPAAAAPSFADAQKGERVTVVGKVSQMPWQHMIDVRPGKTAEYFDLPSGGQIVVYVAGTLPPGKKLELTGKVLVIEGTSKRPGSKEVATERQLDVESWRAVER